MTRNLSRQYVVHRDVKRNISHLAIVTRSPKIRLAIVFLPGDQLLDQIILQNDRSEVKCGYRKLCNGFCGLKMHQHSCHGTKGQREERFESLDSDEAYDGTGEAERNIDFNSTRSIKPGVKLDLITIGK